MLYIWFGCSFFRFNIRYLFEYVFIVDIKVLVNYEWNILGVFIVFKLDKILCNLIYWVKLWFNLYFDEIW